MFKMMFAMMGGIAAVGSLAWHRARRRNARACACGKPAEACCRRRGGPCRCSERAAE